MLFGLFNRRTVDLRDYLRQTKKIKVNGVPFEIKKVNIDDHLAGLNVILKMHDLYKREKPTDKTAMIEDNAKVLKFMRDFIYAGVVAPKLSLKDPPEDDAIGVSEILSDHQLAGELTSKIIEHSYGKKKSSNSM